MTLPRTYPLKKLTPVPQEHLRDRRFFQAIYMREKAPRPDDRSAFSEESET